MEGAFPEVGTPEKGTGLFRPPSPNGLALAYRTQCGLQEACRILTGIYVARVVVGDSGIRANGYVACVVVDDGRTRGCARVGVGILIPVPATRRGKHPCQQRHRRRDHQEDCDGE